MTDIFAFHLANPRDARPRKIELFQVYANILFQTKRFRFQDRKFMFKHKLSIPSRNLCQVVFDVFVI